MRPGAGLWSLPVSLLLTLPALAENSTVSNDQLHTWWHEQGVYNFKGPIPDGSVRQSHLYSVQVASAESFDFYDSFIYESIPRNGNGPITIPGDVASIDQSSEDGITIEPLLNTTMAWTQFLYDTDVVLKIDRISDYAPAASSTNITIRPTTLNYTVYYNGTSAHIRVPYDPNGLRFSVEFADDLVSYHTMATAPSCTTQSTPSGDCSYAQNVSSTWDSYYQAYNASMPIVGTEPRNGLLIFASPFPPDELVAKQNNTQTLTVRPGFVTDLNDTDASTIFFPPGVYYFSGTAHAILAESVTWVYLSPGAYVKGALEFTSSNVSNNTVSGFGVLSGEQYVYQANPAADYVSSKSDSMCLKMFKGISSGSSHLTFTLNGVTMASPPFNSMDFYNDTSSIDVQAWDYKQVGAWFDQTDGLENYPNSYVRNVFYHSSDDTIKLYYDNATIANITIWKKTNGPAIQLGWSPRNVSNISVSNVSQIHSRYYSNDAAGTTGDALIMSTVFPQDAQGRDSADCNAYLANVTISNFRAEGISPSLLRISPLMNYDGLTVQTAWIEQLSPIDTGLQISWARKWTDASQGGSPVSFGAQSDDGIGVRVQDFSVGDEKISFDASNWDAMALGSLDFDEYYWGHWTVG